MKLEQKILIWLLEGDSSIRWQVMKDIQNLDLNIYQEERRKLRHSGWCSRLLALQGENGLWNNSLYNGKWISTTYTLYLLKLMGLLPLDPQALLACDQLFSQGLYQGVEFRFSRNQAVQDLGVCGFILSLCCYFGYERYQLHQVAAFLAGQQQNNGSWSPNNDEASKGYEFETTLLILESLLLYRESYQIQDPWLIEAERQGQEFLLAHHLYLEGNTAIKNDWSSFSFPPYWFYDVLTALEYFRSFKTNKDTRLQAGIDLVLKKQNKEGAWFSGKKHSGKTYFDIENSGQPSRWNTLRALRVLHWWNASN